MMEGNTPRGDAALEFERYELHEGRPYVFEVGRRGFLGLFTGGLVILVTAPRALAQESGRGGRGRPEPPTDLGAWLHIDEQGRVTVFTGKVEVGQNIRTSLAQAVADELRVPMTAITMVMGDTGRVPWDQGTFGSLSTPRMAPVLSKAAAAARELLIDRAAAAWAVDRTTLSARDGRIVGAGARVLSYGELTKGARLAATVRADLGVEAPARWSVRGSAAPKVNGRDIVTGAHRYPSDIVRPGMLHGRIVRPSAMGATLVSVDDSRAKALPGVTVVRDGEFVGVVAPSERAAARAAAAVRAEWRTRPNQPTSKTIYEYLKKTPADTVSGRGAPQPRVTGDVDAARTTAARRFASSYRIPYIAHVPLEPRAAVAEWVDGGLTVWTGTQRPFGVKDQLMEAFSLPAEKVRVLMPDTGSGYGGKHTGECAIEAARLARAAARPVKLVWTRAEEFAWAYARPAGVIDVTSAVDARGRLIAWEFDNWNSGASGIETPYTVPNQRIAFHPSESPLRQGSYRGLAATANHFAREMHIDEVARALRVDAVEFRLTHLAEPRQRDVLTAVAQRIGWPGTAGGHALGIACGTEKDSYVATGAALSRTDAGFKVERIVIAFECGAIVNPDGLRNQVLGSVIQGLGGALFESLEFADGQLLNGTLEQYRVPRFKDVPDIDVILLDRRDLPSEGAGETPIVCVAPAIGSAARAFGRVDDAMPVRLLKA